MTYEIRKQQIEDEDLYLVNKYDWHRFDMQQSKYEQNWLQTGMTVVYIALPGWRHKCILKKEGVRQLGLVFRWRDG